MPNHASMSKAQWFISILCIFLATVKVQASSTVIEGFLSKDASGYVLLESETQKSFRLRAANSETQKNLDKLNNFDFISGLGEFISEDIVLLDSVELVGLRKLLGLWRATDGLINFLDYSSLSIFIEQQSDITRYNFNYAVTPSTGEQWKIFLTDSKSVILGSLSFKRSKLHLEMYDPKTGNIAAKFTLTKVQRN